MLDTEMSRPLNRTIEKILLFLDAKGSSLLAFVFFGALFFVLLFGNYPQWLYEDYSNRLKSYFEPELQNISFVGYSERSNSIWLGFSYSDGATFSSKSNKRLNKDEVVRAWKIDILNLICTHEDIREELQKGKSIEIDLKDGDIKKGNTHIVNMRVYNDRC